MLPKKLAKMCENTSSVCWKCEQHERAFYHLEWKCNKAKKKNGYKYTH